ncbi:PREDICTED: olfactory receptor 5V1-like [Nanorana parkeri]|uniref:olfactory receptor 5V1-like n=1 Tax=Nanorana parkeri TaxID=125878 RepID=UPI0008542D00|nr:PREDICTED: olfactory receptor 5V1-like [Nanorana parkeri]
MENMNVSSIKEFILVGFSEAPPIQHLLFVVFLFIYIITVIGNFSIISAYKFTSDLHTPMYFFLANFSFLEICYISATVPKLLSSLLLQDKSISFFGCVVQMFCFLLLGGTECYMLAAMAYDRYNAICHPLLYGTIMNKRTCLGLIAVSWVSGTINSLTHTVLTFALSFCGANAINHFFCDIPPLLDLACSSTEINEIVLLVACGCVIVSAFLLTIASYVRIISAILNIKSTSGRKKAFSTCASHLIVVALFYGSATFMYFRPKSSYSMNKDRLIAALYAFIAPLLNPFIYSLRNNDVKVAVKKIFCRIFLVQRY